MTKKEFLESKEPLAMIVSLNPKTGKVLYDTYPYEQSSMWLKDFEKDFPDMIHFMHKNPASSIFLMNKLGISDESV